MIGQFVAIAFWIVFAWTLIWWPRKRWNDPVSDAWLDRQRRL